MSGLTSGLVGIQTQAAQPAFLATLTAREDNVTGDATAWLSNQGTDNWTVIFDQSGDFDGDGTFTAPVTGRYAIGGNANVLGITSGMTYSQVTLSTSNRAYYAYVGDAGNVFTTVGDNLGMSGHAIADMDAGDTFLLSTQFNGGSKVADIYHYTKMWAMLVA